MKKMFLFFCFTLSIAAQGNTINTVFKNESQVPVELQKQILDFVNIRCGNLVSNYGLHELKTTIREYNRVDQGMVDAYFTTTLTSEYYFDKMHPSTTNITIESERYNFSSGDNFVVISASSSDGCDQEYK